MQGDEQTFRQGDTVLLIDESGEHRRHITYVTKTGIVVLDTGGRFRQDGTATNNLGRARIELLQDLKPGDVISFEIVGRIERVTESGYVVFAHGVADIPILKSSVRNVMPPSEE